MPLVHLDRRREKQAGGLTLLDVLLQLLGQLGVDPSVLRLVVSDPHFPEKVIEEIVASGLIYLPSGVRDLQNPVLNEYLSRYVRGSDNIGHVERIKTLKLLWDAIGTEFGGRHELYEINYAGNQDEIRLQCLRHAQGSGALAKMTELVDKCLSDYDQNGWLVPHLHNNDDINVLDKLRQ